MPCEKVIIIFFQEFYSKSLNLGYIQNISFITKLSMLHQVAGLVI